MSEEIVKFVLRIPPKLHKKIKRNAAANRISMNKEIINLLDQTKDSKKLDRILEILEQ